MLQKLIQRIRWPDRQNSSKSKTGSIRLLGSLILTYSIVAIIAYGLRSFLLPNSESNMLRSIGLGFIVVVTIFTLSRYASYRITFIALLVLGYSLIVYNAWQASTLHIEISYILVIPLLSTIMFSFRESVIISVITVLISTVFLYAIEEIPSDIKFDLLILVLLVVVFIVFAAYYRNRGEQERQQLVIREREVQILKKFLGNVGHDLRTPITVINTKAYLLSRQSPPPTPQQLEKIESIQTQTKHLEKLLEDIFTMSELDSDVEHGTLDWIDFDQIVEECFNSFRDIAEERHIKMSMDLSDISIQILVNRRFLRQSLMHMIENAINYTDSGGTVRIETRQDAKNLIIKIRDTGIGISEEDLPYIFDRFYRVDKARSTITGGSGLGLAIVKRTIELYGGTISVTSALGAGTTFTITFPTQGKNSLAIRYLSHSPMFN